MTKTIAALLAVLVGALGTPAWAQVRVHDPMVRMVPPGQPISVAFMILHNHGMDEKILVKVHSDVADAAEMHNHILAEGMMKMRRVDTIVVPAHGQVELKPGGLHIMLIGLSRNLQLGERVTINLEFADGDRLTVNAPVQMAGDMHTPTDHTKHAD
ncbi:MAG TPA: copper chaperone PCu(A)C [Gammaproteobacteria bacterium]|nr:copper chaperone PCu(A)C [Gammaproteobacteria bacterium]